MAKEPTNDQIADVLEQIADLLETEEDSNAFRVRAYREGAETIRNQKDPVAGLIKQNEFDELKALPNIGQGIASVVGEYVSSGKSQLLEQLQSKQSPEAVFAKVPGVGEELATRIVEQLHLHTLPELETAAYDGRLDTVEGFGAKRVEGIRTALAGMLSRSALSRQQERTEKSISTAAQTDGISKKSDDARTEERPSVELLLAVDEEYRKQGDADKLQKIAPKRFNPKNEAWLPVLRTKREGWNFTALFSNTAKAHELEKTHDWVVIYYQKNDKERQNTVVTETQGALKGKRVVRGREAENRKFYGVGEKK